MAKLDQAIEDLDLEAWIEDYDDVKAGGTREIRVQNCPKCGNSKYKLYVNTEKQRWICYVCDWGRGLADVCNLLAAISGRSKGSIQLELARSVQPAPKLDNFTQKLSEAFFPTQEPPEEVEEVLLPGDESLTGVTGKRVRDYAYSRGLTDRDLDHYELRVASKLRKRHTGPFLVFPVFFQDIPVAWQGRRAGNREPKYISSDDIADWLFPMPDDFDSHELVILTEGVFDAMALLRYGFSACCTFGKRISSRQLAHLRRNRVTELAFAWDANALGDIEREARRAQGTFPKVSVVDLSHPNKVGVADPDPGDCLEHDELAKWLCHCVKDRINTDSSDFYHWRLQRRFRKRS